MTEPSIQAGRRQTALGRPEPAIRARIAGGIGWLSRLLQTWSTRELERRYLESFTDAQLRDIGLTRAQARREAGKPFWRT